MNSKIVLYFSIILMSTVKFFGGVLISYAAKMNFWEIFVLNSMGTIAGVIIFGKGGEWINHLLHLPWFSVPYHAVMAKIRPLLHLKKKPKPFSRKRKMVKFWNKYGIWGLVAISPFILAPPLAVGVALSFKEKSERFIPLLCIGCVVWSLIAALFKDVILMLISWVQLFFH